VVVDGAGIVGTSIAFHLSRRGVALTVIDKGKPGAGTSGTSFAYLNSYGKEPRPYHDLNRRSMDSWDRFARRLGTDVGLRWGGKLLWENSADGAARVRESVGRLQAWGYAARLIDEAEMRRIEPGITTDGVTAAVYCENEGHVDPPKVAEACLEKARVGGAEVLTDTPVTGISLGGGGHDRARAVAVQTPDRVVPCDVLVLAAGVGITELASMASLDIPQKESPGFLALTQPLPPILQTAAVLYPPPPCPETPEVHIRQRTDGSVMLGSSKEESRDLNGSQAEADDLLERAVRYVPVLEGTEVYPMPIAYRPMPTDSYPIIGFTQAVPNLYVALTHSGVTLAPIIGELATMEIVDGASIDILTPYRLSRFS